MKKYEQYLTPEEAAVRLNRTEGEIWRMLETGMLPALLRGELSSLDGTPIGFDFALLKPEDVARVVDQGGDDFLLEWIYAYGNGKASCTPARKSSIRVLWEPSLFSDIAGSKDDGGQTAPAAPPEAVPVVNSASESTIPDPERRLARLRALGGAEKYKRGEWKFAGITKLVVIEKSEGRKRSDEKTIRADLREAADNEREAKQAGFGSGFGQR